MGNGTNPLVSRDGSIPLTIQSQQLCRLNLTLYQRCNTAGVFPGVSDASRKRRISEAKITHQANINKKCINIEIVIKKNPKKTHSAQH